MRRRSPFQNPNRFPFNPQRQNFEARIFQAFSLFDQGDFLSSAQLFEELGGIAEARNGPRAPRFYIQAGRAYLHAGNISAGMSLLEKGRRLFIESGRSEIAARISAGLVNELTAMGLKEPAQIVGAWSGSSNPNLFPGRGHPALPIKCPSCGGPLLPNEITWLDENTAECDYCGSPIRA